MSERGQRRIWQLTVGQGQEGRAVDFLAQQTQLSRSKIKLAMTQGAVWLRRGRSKLLRLRRATSMLQQGDLLKVYYDSTLLVLDPPIAKRLWHCRDYSVWYKPPGLMAQGNEYGDHASLLRQAQLQQAQGSQVYLVHRLDREARGLMLVAHTRRAAGQLSQLFRGHELYKEYEVRVLGKIEQAQGCIDISLDGKAAMTEFERLQYDAESNTNLLRVWIKTGRTHQIRRHLALVDHPVMGDPRYGRGNKSCAGLCLTATCLAFRCPLSQEDRKFELSRLMWF